MFAIAFVMTMLRDRLDSDRGATAVEYGLLVAGIAALIIAAVFAFGGQIADLFDGVGNQLQGPA